MGVVIRQSAISSTMAYIGVGIGYLNAVILMPAFMTPEQIGLYRALGAITMMLVPFCMVGMGSVLVKYFPKYDNKAKLYGITLGTSLIAYVVLIGLFTTFRPQFVEFFSDKSPEVGEYFQLIVIWLFLMVLFTFFSAVSNVNYDIISPDFIREPVYKLLHTVLILFVGYNIITFNHYLYGHLFSYVILVLSILLIVTWKYNFRISFSGFANTESLKSIYNFAGFIFITGIGSTFVTQIGQVLIVRYLGTGDNGIYAIALFMAAVIELPKRSVLQISTPIISQAFHDKRLDDLNSHYKKASVNLFLVGSFIFLLITLNLHSIYDIMPNGELYKGGIPVVYIMGITKLIEMVFSINGPIISMSPLFRYNIVFIIILTVLALIANIILIPIYGFVGAAMAALIAYSLFNISKFVLLRIKFQLSPFTWDSLKIVIFILVTFTLIWFIPRATSAILDIFIRSITLSILFLIFVRYFISSKELLNTSLTILRKIKFK